METLFNSNFGLFEINKLVKRFQFLEISFKNDKRRFAGAHLHSFQTEDGTAKNLTDLKPGDKIWIDISAYTADKSLFVHNPFGTKGRYQRAVKLNKNS